MENYSNMLKEKILANTTKRVSMGTIRGTKTDHHLVHRMP